jgi:nucleotide-binding universal stress UspA family protein
VLNIKNILFPTDFSRCATQALDHALFLARRLDAKLHMIHAIVLHQEDPHNPAFHFPDPSELQEKLARMAREKMNHVLRASSESRPNLDVVKEELRGYSVADLILEYAGARDIDLIVMGTHGHRGLDYMFLGSVAQQVVHEASCPVYTIRESENPGSPGEIDTILSPIDFSDHSSAALSAAKEAARLYEAKLQILHVVERAPNPTFFEPPAPAYGDLETSLPDMIRGEMERFYNESAGISIPAKFHVVEGHVVHRILEYVSSNNIGMIVIATHGLSGFKHFLLGSVAEKVIRRAACPVLTIKAFGKTPAKSGSA